MIALVDESHTTIAVQRYLSELAGVQSDTAAEPVVRAMLERAVDRLKMICGRMLHGRYPRLTRGPTNLHADEMLGALVERLLKAMREVRPGTVRQFFGLANQHVLWELNDLARKLDQRPAEVELHESFAHAAETGPPSSCTTPNLSRILEAIERLPDDEREVFNLVRIQGMTQPEAAAVIGVSAKTVHRRLNRGLLLLTDALGDLVSAPREEVSGE